jgi:hypothetical protein
MSIELPKSIGNYFAADRDRNPEAVANCFSGSATVRDEGHVYSGPDEIRRWKAGSSEKYTYTATPIAMAQERGRTVVTSHLEGDFPGSPVDLRYFFRLEEEKIAELEIVL